MAKRPIVEQFRDFVEALPAESNEPMTKSEIASSKAKKKTKGGVAKRATKNEAKKIVRKAAAKTNKARGRKPK
jgi:hypothetical protein